MRVRMRPRYEGGTKLPEDAFAAQPWVRGFLHLDKSGQVPRLLIYDPVAHFREPIRVLYRPFMTACFSDTISFSGVEKHGRQWVQQTWFCETSKAS